jgi:hypothetical protein
MTCRGIALVQAPAGSRSARSLVVVPLGPRILLLMPPLGLALLLPDRVRPRADGLPPVNR